MAFNKIVQYDTTPNFLESEEGLILKTYSRADKCGNCWK